MVCKKKGLVVEPEFERKKSEPHVTSERETGVTWGFSGGKQAKRQRKGS